MVGCMMGGVMSRLTERSKNWDEYSLVESRLV